MATKKILNCLFLCLIGLAGCSKSEDTNPTCTTYATVRDLTGLDGCGMMLELDNGTKLRPTGDLWNAFTAYDKQRVRISYEEMPWMGDVCLAGSTVQINCIEKIGLGHN